MSCQGCKKSKLQKAKNILEGFSKLVIKDTSTEELAAKRLAICNNCDNAISMVKVNKVDIKRCNLCTCLIEAKVRAKEENCCAGKW